MKEPELDMFEERIDPAQSRLNLLAEHFVRYELVCQFTDAGCAFFDLGCGNGFGLMALQALKSHSILYGIDVSEAALTRAAQIVGNDPRIRLMRLDLSQLHSYEAIEILMNAHDGSPRVLICFEVVEHLDDFKALAAFVSRQVQRGVQAFLSVPNDAFWGTQNHFHKCMFGEDSLLEFAQLFESAPKIYKQYPIQGSTILPHNTSVLEEDEVVGRLLPKFLGRSHLFSTPSHFILHFGHAGPNPASIPARLSIADEAAERQWTSQRESDMLFYRQEALRLKSKWRRFQNILNVVRRTPPSAEGENVARGLEILQKLSLSLRLGSREDSHT
jgi:SAM-dependent methyltransferase